MTGVLDFTWTIHPGRIVFGAGAVQRLGNELRAAGKSRALILTTPFQRDAGAALADSLPGLVAGIFSEAAMHTPVEVTDRAMTAFAETGADCTLALGGGSTIGLGKAIAWRNDAMQFVVATTYAGSEVTNILGETKDGLKTTMRGPKILPEVVIYDPELTLTLPVGMSVTSGLNAMAHAIEGLYAQDRNPVMSLVALEGIRALKEALPAIVAAPRDIAARGRALYGSWLCGTVLGAVGMALHHKLCHTLGGSFDMPHAETHAVLIPHTAAYNQAAARTELAPAAELFGGDLGGGLWDFAKSIGTPLALRDLGLAEADLDRAADLAARNPYWNPRPIERDAIRALLGRAWAGERPE
jgi:maleylacetate reductase